MQGSNLLRQSGDGGDGIGGGGPRVIRLTAADCNIVPAGQVRSLHFVIDDGKGIGGDGKMKGLGLAGLEVDTLEAAKGADGDGDAGVEGRDIELGDFVAFGSAGVGEADA